MKNTNDNLAKLHWDAIVAQKINPHSPETLAAVRKFNAALDNELAAISIPHPPRADFSFVGLCVVRLYDGMDNQWIDESEPVPYVKALEIWMKKTKNGTEKIAFREIDYYRIFPADTRMIYSGGFGER